MGRFNFGSGAENYDFFGKIGFKIFVYFSIEGFLRPFSIHLFVEVFVWLSGGGVSAIKMVAF